MDCQVRVVVYADSWKLLCFLVWTIGYDDVSKYVLLDHALPRLLPLLARIVCSLPVGGVIVFEMRAQLRQSRRARADSASSG